MFSLTAIIPFYNEEDYLEDSFKRLYLSNVANQIYLVDDGSTDSSKKIALEIEKTFDNVRYFSNKSNYGKGSALTLVKDHIQTSHVVIHDADLEYYPNDLHELKKISIINNNSLILGSRFSGKFKEK